MSDPENQNLPWSNDDYDRAESQGWLLVDHDGSGLMEIQLCQDSETPFNSDEEALAFVKAEAAKGDVTCSRALAIHERDADVIAGYEVSAYGR